MKNEQFANTAEISAMTTPNTKESFGHINRLVSGALRGIVLCIAFFVVAFLMTIYSDRHEIPYFNINITGSTNVTQNAVSDIVHEVMYSKEYQQKLKRLVSDRERIVKREHDYFRAELGTWLSIFGLLSILGTIMVSVLSFVCQHLSLKEEKNEIYKSLRQMGSEFEENKKQLIEVKAQIAKAEKWNATISRNYEQSIAASSALAPDVTSDSSVENDFDEELANIDRECKRFINMWWWENDEAFEKEVDKKIEAGIVVLKKFNELLSKSIAKKGDITTILKKLNLINIYLGQKDKINPFYTRFCNSLKREQPLKIKIDVVEDALKQTHPEKWKTILGYYKNLLDYQSSDTKVLLENGTM